MTGAPALRFAILTVLLQWCVDSLPPDAQVLEIGAGIGTTAIGLALASAHNQNALRRIVASDSSEDEVLSLLRQNAEANGVADLPIVKWDASRGAASLDSLPVPARQLTHVIGSDLIYFGGHRIGSRRKSRRPPPPVSAMLEGGCCARLWSLYVGPGACGADE